MYTTLPNIGGLTVVGAISASALWIWSNNKRIIQSNKKSGETDEQPSHSSVSTSGNNKNTKPGIDVHVGTTITLNQERPDSIGTTSFDMTTASNHDFDTLVGIHAQSSSVNVAHPIITPDTTLDYDKAIKRGCVEAATSNSYVDWSLDNFYELGYLDIILPAPTQRDWVKIISSVVSKSDRPDEDWEQHISYIIATEGRAPGHGGSLTVGILVKYIDRKEGFKVTYGRSVRKTDLGLKYVSHQFEMEKVKKITVRQYKYLGHGGCQTDYTVHRYNHDQGIYSGWEIETHDRRGLTDLVNYKQGMYNRKTFLDVSNHHEMRRHHYTPLQIKQLAFSNSRPVKKHRLTKSGQPNPVKKRRLTKSGQPKN